MEYLLYTQSCKKQKSTVRHFADHRNAVKAMRKAFLDKIRRLGICEQDREHVSITENRIVVKEGLNTFSWEIKSVKLEDGASEPVILIRVQDRKTTVDRFDGVSKAFNAIMRELKAQFLSACADGGISKLQAGKYWMPVEAEFRSGTSLEYSDFSLSIGKRTAWSNLCGHTDWKIFFLSEIK